MWFIWTDTASSTVRISASDSKFAGRFKIESTYLPSVLFLHFLQNTLCCEDFYIWSQFYKTLYFSKVETTNLLSPLCPSLSVQDRCKAITTEEGDKIICKKHLTTAFQMCGYPSWLSKRKHNTRKRWRRTGRTTRTTTATRTRHVMINSISAK